MSLLLDATHRVVTEHSDLCVNTMQRAAKSVQCWNKRSMLDLCSQSRHPLRIISFGRLVEYFCRRRQLIVAFSETRSVRHAAQLLLVVEDQTIQYNTIPDSSGRAENLRQELLPICVSPGSAGSLPLTVLPHCGGNHRDSAACRGPASCLCGQLTAGSSRGLFLTNVIPAINTTFPTLAQATRCMDEESHLSQLGWAACTSFFPFDT